MKEFKERLVLFDLDGTLVDVMKAHLTAINLVAHQIWGVKGFPDGLDVQGKPQLQYLREMCLVQGVPESDIESCLPQAARLLSETTIAHFPQPVQSAVLPGVTSLLEALTMRKIPRALVTGTLSGTAQAVLTATKLEDYFPICVMGDSGLLRRDLVLDAICKSQDKFRIQFSRDKIVAVGDSPNDIRTARELGIRAVGVATGFSSLTELAAYSPDAVLPDLSDLQVAIAAVLGDDPKDIILQEDGSGAEI